MDCGTHSVMLLQQKSAKWPPRALTGLKPNAAQPAPIFENHWVPASRLPTSIWLFLCFQDVDTLLELMYREWNAQASVCLDRLGREQTVV